MTDGFQITVTDDTITLVAEAFTLVFDKENVGITSYKYETNGTWHECVESGNTPPVLFSSYHQLEKIPGTVMYPSGGITLSVVRETAWFVDILQVGYLRSQSDPDSTDYPIYIRWRIWPSGILGCRMKAINESGEALVLQEDAYRLNPADDQDVNPDRDTAPNLKWFGFYSNNTGGGAGDMSHDAIVIPWQTVLDKYGTSGNTNRIYQEEFNWTDNGELVYEFLIVLSVYGSWGDCTSSANFQTRGDKLSADFTNPDPLDGSQNAGDVLVGSNNGFTEELVAYRVTVQ